MKTTKYMGIWMDHSIAHMMDANGETISTSTIESGFTPQEKRRTAVKGEYMMHNDEQQKGHAYYKKLSEAIKNYDQVVLFGPSTAKEELANLLKQDKNFERIKVEVKHADKMTAHQQEAFVRDYFKNSVYSRRVA